MPEIVLSTPKFRIIKNAETKTVVIEQATKDSMGDVIWERVADASQSAGENFLFVRKKRPFEDAMYELLMNGISPQS